MRMSYPKFRRLHLLVGSGEIEAGTLDVERNRFVAAVADSLLVAHANLGSRTLALIEDLIA